MGTVGDKIILLISKHEHDSKLKHGWVSAMLGCVHTQTLEFHVQMSSSKPTPSPVKLLNDFMSGRPPTQEHPYISSGVNQSALLWNIIIELHENVKKVWLNHCDWPIKNYLIATSINYSTHLCLIAPCFVSMK